MQRNGNGRGGKGCGKIGNKMRLIDADKMIKGLSRFVTCKLGEIKTVDIKKFIEEQPTVEPNEWISCSERLPEDLNDKNIDCFLVTDGFLIWMAYYNSEIGWQFAECTNSRNKIDWTEIIAWMPLPSTWKGENNAEK